MTYQQEYYAKNKDKINAWRKIYREKNKERLNFYMREYRIKNKEKFTKYKKTYISKNKEYINEYRRNYYKKYYHLNKEKYNNQLTTDRKYVDNLIDKIILSEEELENDYKF